jgi:fucose permease
LALVLASVGLWYVLAHHLQAIIITVLSALGGGSGLLVLYRGYHADMHDLIWIGLFLIVIFPIIFWQAIKQPEPMEAPVRIGRRAMFSRKARS